MAVNTDKFPLGQTVITPAARDAIHVDTVQSLLRRHAAGDWGDMDAEDKVANDRALNGDFRLFSSYVVGEMQVWIITEHDRSVTTVLLPSDY